MLFSKRNRTQTIDTQQEHIERVSKLSHIFHKFTNTITPNPRHVLKRPSMPQLGSFFKSDSQLQMFDKDSCFTKDMTFERRRYQQNMQTQRQLKDDSYATLSQKEHPEYSPSLIGSQVPSISHSNHKMKSNNNNVPSILIKRPSLTTSPSLDGSWICQIKKHNSNSSSNKSITRKRISTNTKSTSSHSSDLHENGKSYASMKESPNLTTHSGDLTARQFANIAGIKILSENDDDEDVDLNDSVWEGDGNVILHNTGSSTMDGQVTTLSNISKGALLDQDKLSAGTSSSILTLNYSTTSNGSSNHKQQSQPQPQIWDSAFWNDNTMESVAYSKALTQRKLSAPTERRHNYYQQQQHHSQQQQQQQQKRQLKQQQHDQHSPDTTILHDLRRINTISNDHMIHQHRQPLLRRNQSYVIKKGRFEVSIETSSDSTEIDTRPATHL